MSKVNVSITFILCALILLAAVTPIEATPITESEDPPYAKWGRMAMQETKEKYPNAFIIDYLHVGRQNKNGTATETFKLWLRERDGREFGVYVVIQFEVATEKVVQITFEETDR